MCAHELAKIQTASRRILEPRDPLQAAYTSPLRLKLSSAIFLAHRPNPGASDVREAAKRDTIARDRRSCLHSLTSSYL